MGSIVTFYSYKGGVGRSMALANVAVLLARRGLRVLAIDWDLEAPGLERYFAHFASELTGSGILRLLVAGQESATVDFTKFTSAVHCDTAHPITLLTSGREQDDDYSRNLESFNWSTFFARGGGALLERLRSEWRQSFDMVLIDSRTGLSDTGGVCTIQLLDIVVAMFTANHQSLYGVRDVLRLAQRARQSLAYDRMPFSILPVPSRWGITEFQETNLWYDRVVEGVQEFYADWLPTSLSPRQIVESTKIPHHSYFGFGERLAVVEQGVTDPTGMGFAYNKIASFLASDLKDLACLVGQQLVEASSTPPPPRPISDVIPVDYAYDVFISCESSVPIGWVIEFSEAIRLEAEVLIGTPLRVFSDIREIVISPESSLDVLREATRSKVLIALLTPRYWRQAGALKEFNLFYRKDRPILPLILAREALREIPQDIAWIDAERLLPLKQRGSISNRQVMANIVEELGERLRTAPSFDLSWLNDAGESSYGNQSSF